MTLERRRRILCCSVKEDGRWPRRLEALKSRQRLDVCRDCCRAQRRPLPLEGCSRKVPALRARSPVLCVSQSRRPLLCLPPRFHRPPGRRPAGLLSDRHRRTRLGSGNSLDRDGLCTVAKKLLGCERQLIAQFRLTLSPGAAHIKARALTETACQQLVVDLRAKRRHFPAPGPDRFLCAVTDRRQQ